MSNLQKTYQETIKPKLSKKLGVKNEFEVPKVEKIVVNIGLGGDGKDKKVIKSVKKQLAAITGQVPVITKAKRSIANFSIRQGDPIGVKVTLRRSKMYNFLEKLVKIVLPRLRDFRGVKIASFDQSGNYTLGLSEQIVFPEIEYDEIDKIGGLEITIVSNTKEKDKAKELLELMGMPFEKVDKQKKSLGKE